MGAGKLGTEAMLTMKLLEEIASDTTKLYMIITRVGRKLNKPILKDDKYINELLLTEGLAEDQVHLRSVSLNFSRKITKTLNF